MSCGHRKGQLSRLSHMWRAGNMYRKHASRARGVADGQASGLLGCRPRTFLRRRRQASRVGRGSIYGGQEVYAHHRLPSWQRQTVGEEVSSRKVVVYINANRKTCGKCHYLPEWVGEAKHGIAMCGLYEGKVRLSRDRKNYTRRVECVEDEVE